MSRSSVSWKYHTPEQLSEQANAQDVLAQLLSAGQLVLLLGAGASSGLGLPRWNELVQRVAKQLGDDTDYSGVKSGVELMAAIDRLRRNYSVDNEQMIEQVSRGLYGPAVDRPSPSHLFDVTTLPLLSALGALMMASARGSSGEVFTLNFDDVLEWYLDLHGFSSEVISELPATLRGDVDVHVFHLHGFVPLMRERYDPSSWIVLSQTELEERLSKDATDPWEALLLSRLQSKVFLVIGTSMSDVDINVSLKIAKRTADRPLGFVLGTHDHDKAAELRERGLVPVSFDDIDDIPRYLLGICQRAAQLR